MRMGGGGEVGGKKGRSDGGGGGEVGIVMARRENRRRYSFFKGTMVKMLLTSPEVHLKYLSSHPSPPDEVSYNNKQNNN